MAVDKRLVLTYAFTNTLFIAAGVITLVISLMWRMDALNSPSMCFSLVPQTDCRHWFGSTECHLHDDTECRRNGCRNHHDRGRSTGYSRYQPRSCSKLTFQLSLCRLHADGCIHMVGLSQGHVLLSLSSVSEYGSSPSTNKQTSSTPGSRPTPIPWKLLKINSIVADTGIAHPRPLSLVRRHVPMPMSRLRSWGVSSRCNLMRISSSTGFSPRCLDLWGLGLARFLRGRCWSRRGRRKHGMYGSHKREFYNYVL
jgi:hypothetical protein